MVSAREDHSAIRQVSSCWRTHTLSRLAMAIVPTCKLAASGGRGGDHHFLLRRSLGFQDCQFLCALLPAGRFKGQAVTCMLKDGNLREALEKAKEAGKKERQLCRLRDCSLTLGWCDSKTKWHLCSTKWILMPTNSSAHQWRRFSRLMLTRCQWGNELIYRVIEGVKIGVWLCAGAAEPSWPAECWPHLCRVSQLGYTAPGEKRQGVVRKEKLIWGLGHTLRTWHGPHPMNDCHVLVDPFGRL